MGVVVVGGGIIGLASAYYLASRGESVTLLERGALGMQSTGRSVGGIRKQYTTPINVELSLLSTEVWATFEETFGIDIAYRQPGYLYLAREATTAERFDATVEMQRALGVETELLAPEAARSVCPLLEADRFLKATYLGTDGFADPNLAVQGYAGAARDAGVDIQTRTPVTDLLEADDRVVGVETPDGRIEAEYVVNATGGWLSRLAGLAGVDLPVSPRRRQVVVVDPEVPVPESVPLTIDLDTGLYFRPERDGRALVGGHFGGADPDVDPDAYTEGYDMAWAIEALELAAEVAGYFGEETALRDGWAGLYAVTPDHHPILDEVAPGFVVAGGFSGHGFQHAPATGQIVADLVVDGGTSLVDLDRLGLGRFGTGETQVEHHVA